MDVFWQTNHNLKNWLLIFLSVLNKGSLGPHVGRFLLGFLFNFCSIKNFQKLGSLSPHPEKSGIVKVGAFISPTDLLTIILCPLHSPHVTPILNMAADDGSRYYKEWLVCTTSSFIFAKKILGADLNYTTRPALQRAETRKDENTPRNDIHQIQT